MRRDKLNDLAEWKYSPSRKPLIIRGARQVGKTWLMKEFGRLYYKQTVYLNFEKNRRLQGLFKDDFDIKRVLTALQAESGLVIDAATTLIIFDEIQSLPEAITALKYFREEAPQYNIVAAGSLLGVALHSGTSFPVGSVEFMDLFPLSYREFLDALGDTAMTEMLVGSDWELIKVYRSKFIDRLRQYYYVGGMPEAVLRFSDNQGFSEVREIQKQILYAYAQDFSKYAPVNIVPRIRMLWESVPSQLAKENKKFIYGLIKEGSRAREYEIALSWLLNCGLVHKVFRTSRPAMPLKAYEDSGAFKLFISDVGLLSAMCDIDSRTLLEGNRIFTEFKGSLTEQYIFQQLITTGKYAIYYWTAERATAEVDFLIQYEGNIIPVEVKAEENLQARSLRVYNEKFKPGLVIRTSMSDYREEEWLTNLPLYAIDSLTDLLKQ